MLSILLNGGNPLGTNATNPQFYNNNDLNDGGSLPFEFDGFTDVFVASAIGLTPGTHHLKIAIADTSDSVLDSGVFIQGGSVSDTPPADTVVPEPGTLGMLAFGIIAVASGYRRKINKMNS